MRLPEICYGLGQQVPTGDFTYIDVGSIDNERACVTDRVEVLGAHDAPSRARKLVEQGTVLYSTVRPYLKNVAIVTQAYAPRAIASTAFAVMHPHTGMSPKYLLYYLRGNVFTEFVASKMVGVAYPAINDASFFKAVIAIPPLAEQARIVARLDELMRLCDALEAKGRLEAEQHARLLTALLGSLTDSRSPEELAANWQRVAAGFDILLDRPEAVDALEAVALRLAVCGRLLSSIKRGSGTEGDSSLPVAWVASTIGQVASVVTDGTHKTPRYVARGVRFVSAKDVKSGCLSFDSCKYISREEHEQLTKRCRPERGDILVSKSGSIGTVVRVQVDEEFSLFESLALIKFDQTQVDGEFLRLAIQDACNTLTAAEIKGVAVKHLHLNVLRSLRVVLPPIDEQRRIIARVEQLRRICADLRERLTAALAVQARLAERLASDVFQSPA